MRRDNEDVMGEKPVKDDSGALSLDQKAKEIARKQHYEKLLNVEFPWNPEDLSEQSPVEGPSEGHGESGGTTIKKASAD